MKDLLRLLGLLQPYWAWVGLGIFLSFVTLMANVGLMAISGWFITAMAIAGVAGLSINYFTPAALIRLFAILRTTGRYGERLVTHDTTFRILAELRVWFYQRIEIIAPAGLENYHSGDVLSRIRADIDTLNLLYLRLVVPLAVALLASLVFVISLLFYHPLLALVELSLLLLVGVLVPLLTQAWGHASGAKVVSLTAQIRTALVNDLQGMGELLIYGAATAHAAQLEQLSQELAKRQQILASLNGLAQGLGGLGANLAMWLMLILAIPLVSAGTMPAPELTLLALFALASFEAVLPLPLAFQSLGEILAAARRIFALTDQAPSIIEPNQPLAIPDTLHFEFRRVSFRYQTHQPKVLTDVSLTLAAGTKIALLGASGSGKSTILSLLLRFREPESGEIYLNGQALNRYNSEALRTKIAVAPQQSFLFNTTLRANLLLAKPNATQAEIESACRLALIHEFISQQPEAYETWVGETGVRLSGGQAKRVALARALLKDAPVLVLDEPTEGLDPETAQQLMANVLQHVDRFKKSLILITHQQHGLATIDQTYRLSD
ncbi:MAG: thiol reductant ABC exporter subunit CydC [Thiothrix sp.]|nr:MAG: thiol reductant ABC exporter subunit CydC [Thiothrix sp.]